MEHRFQVNLGGIIDLLSNHLYSGPEVFLRELLQNGSDAILARRQREPHFQGRISIEVLRSADGDRSIVFEDNGIGLDEASIHQFLATIGMSSKREDLEARRVDYIGQFGIGLLSCFLVSNEIVVVTKHLNPDSPALEWRGRPDGTYEVKELQGTFPVGTRVSLKPKPGRRPLFEPEQVRELASRFGRLLPIPIAVTHSGFSELINDTPPWRRLIPSRAEWRTVALEYGRDIFGESFLDAIPLECEAGEIEGIAYVLAHPMSPGARQSNRVYLKGILVSDTVQDLLPDWAFFVRCVVDVHGLRPMASREAFAETPELDAAREGLGVALRDYLATMQESNAGQLRRLIGIHHAAMKALAAFDDDFFQLIADYLPFETTAGEMSLGEFRQGRDAVLYVPSVDQFRQISRVAANRGMALLNAGYAFEAQLLAKLAELHPEYTVRAVNAVEVVGDLQSISEAEERSSEDFLEAAKAVMDPFDCDVELRHFQPADTPALFVMGDSVRFRRSLERTKEQADDLWSGVLDNLVSGEATPRTLLALNMANPVVRRLASRGDSPAVRRVVEVLYVQSLMLGHHPIGSREMKAFNGGIEFLIDRVVEQD